MEQKITAKDVVALDDQELNALRDAEASLPAAPWLVWDDGDIGTAYPVERLRANRSTGQKELIQLESEWLFNGYSPTSDQLVAVRNMLPGLLLRLRLAEARIEELEAEAELNRAPF